MVMRKPFLAVCLAVFLSFSGTVIADTITLTSSISSVTVFPDRAVVTRTLLLDLHPGSREIDIEGLPMALLEDSVRVSGKGDASVKIAGIELRKTFLKEGEDERVKAIEKELERLKDESVAIQGVVRGLESQKRFLESIKIKASEDITKDINLARVKVPEWQELLKFYLDNLVRIDGDKKERQKKLRELQERITALENELQGLRYAQPKGQRSAIVGLEVSKGGKFRIDIYYAIMGAGWQPFYDVRANGSSNVVETTYYGEVRQRTGEDWKDVDISLSTARPAVGAKIPDIYPWYIGAQARPMEELERKMMPGTAKAEPFNLEEAAVAAAPLTADISQGYTSTTYKLKKKADIPSDGAVHSVIVSIEKMDASFEYVTVPKLSEFAYLKGQVKNGAEYPLLAGRMNVFVDDNFIGTSSLGTTAPTEEINLSLGIDEGVKIKRETLKREKGKGGFMSGKLRTTLRYRIALTNYKKEKVKVRTLDQIPVSQDKDIVVTLAETSIVPYEKSEQGIIKWLIELKPGEKKEIVFEFYVDYPPEKPVELF